MPFPSHHVPSNLFETLGKSPGSVIVSIGAVKFADRSIISKFYCHIDAESCVRAGLKMDPSTVLWWLQQNEAARLELCKPALPLGNVLVAFATWLDDPNANVWGNGATFDNALLAAAYDASFIPRPWSHLGDRCYRTIKNANRDLPIDPYKVGTHHNAVDDAESQALHLMVIWDREARQRQALALLEDAVRFADSLSAPDADKIKAGLNSDDLNDMASWIDYARVCVKP